MARPREGDFFSVEVRSVPPVMPFPIGGDGGVRHRLFSQCGGAGELRLRGDLDDGFIPVRLGRVGGVDLGFYRYADDKGVAGSIYFPTPDVQEENTHAVYHVDLRWGLEDGELLFRLYRSEFSDVYRDSWGTSRHYSYRNGLEGQLDWSFSPTLSALPVAKKEESGVNSSVLGERTAAAENLAVQLNWIPQEDLYLYLGDFYTRQSAYGDDNSSSHWSGRAAAGISGWPCYPIRLREPRDSLSSPTSRWFLRSLRM